jgi:intein/homing endonuclease
LEKRLRLSQPQIAVKQARTSLILDMSGQGGGKTMNIGVDTFEKIRSCPKAKGFIGANTHEQLTKTTLVKAFGIWKDLGGWTKYDAKSNPDGVFVVNRAPPSHFLQNELLDDYRKTICFQNGALIFTGSLKNYLAHDGKEFAWCHLDETKDTKKEAVTDVIIGRLRQRGLFYFANEVGQPFYFNNEISNAEAKEQGLVAINPLYVHTSPSSSGVEWLLDLFKLKPFEKEIRETLADKFKFFQRTHEDISVVIYQTYWNEKNLPEGHIDKEIRRMTLTEKLLFIDGFPFAKNGSEYFPDFDRSKTVIPARLVPVDFNGTFLMSMDFNVVPYITLLSSQTRYVTKFLNDQTGEKKDFLQMNDVDFKPIEVLQIFVQKEFLKSNPDNETDKVCKVFCEWLQLNEANCDILGYGDATGQSRIVGLGNLTNFKIIENAISQYFYYEKMVKKTNPSNRLRRTFMNRLFAGKYPELEVYISEECVETIRDFEFLKQGVDGGKFKELEKDKSTGQSFQKIGHCFVGETMIQTNEGKKRIDEIKVGEMVLTRKGFKKVKKVFNNGIRDVRKYLINGKIIECTEDHKIFTFNRGFVKVCDVIHSDIFCIFEENKIKCQNIQQNKTFFKSLTDSISDYIQLKNISKVGVLSTELKQRQAHNVTFGRNIMEVLKKVFTFTTKTKINQTMILKILNYFHQKSIQKNILQKNGNKKQSKFFLKKQFQNQKNGTVQKLEENGTKNTQKKVFNVKQEVEVVSIAEMDLKQNQEFKFIVPTNAKSISTIRKRNVFDLEVEDVHEYFANDVLVHNCSDTLEYLVCELCIDYLKEI